MLQSSSTSSSSLISSSTVKLYEFLSLRDIDIIEQSLKHTNDGISYEEFRQLLTRFNIKYRDNDFENVCLKIDLDRDSRIKFNEFIAYFITEMQNDDNAAERLSVVPPIAKSAFVLSTAQRSAILRTFFIPSDNAELLSGNYITVGCFGDVNCWSLKWKLDRIIHVDSIPSTTSSSIELSDKRQIKRSTRVLVLDAILIYNEIICISSVCRDLRFYDLTRSGNLRLYIRNFPSPLNAFHYFQYCADEEHNNCHDDDNNIKRSCDEGKKSRLLFGDFVGSVRLIEFSKNFKTHFRAGSMIRQISYHELMKGHHEAIKCTEYINLHNDIIRQVSYVRSISAMISCSESVLTRNAYLPGVIITYLSMQDLQTQTVLKMNSGATCFAFDESSQTLATGSPDTILRLWNPATSTPKAIFTGHNSGIMHIFIQDGVKIYSLDKSKIIKIWDLHEMTLKQTFAGLKAIFTQEISVTPYYCDQTRDFVIASKKIAIVKCCPRIDPRESDGMTHIAPITLILLNELYRFLVTTCTDSTIIIWDVWNGRKVNWILRAHTALRQGELYPLEITAGNFDSRHQFLITGAIDGSLRVWNFNEGICLRNLQIEGRVEKVFWTHQRIFAVGSDVVTEFHDSNDYKEQINRGKIYDRFHAGEICCASIRSPDSLVTSCTCGEIIFWGYETGQPYLKFNLKNPKCRLQFVYQKSTKRLKKIKLRGDGNKNNYLSYESRDQNKVGDKNVLKANLSCEKTLISTCMLSLDSRPLNVSNGTLLVSLSDGRIQVWSHHHNTECNITDFNAIHVAGDVISAMATDTQNCYLFTGSAHGYIKVWMIVNYCLLTSTEEEISRVKLQSKFPFLLHDDLEGRAKRAVRNQPQPQLLSSYQGHKGASITSLIYSENNQILISSSRDKTVRLWSLSGQYINTIGSHLKWQVLSPNEPLPPDFPFPSIPADLKNIISFTTLKVLEGGNIPTMLSKNVNELRAIEKEMESKEVVREARGDDSEAKTYHRILHCPVVKKETMEKPRYEKPSLDISLPHIPIYRHLRIHRTVPINLPQNIPKCLETNNLPNLEHISHLEPEESKM